MTGIARLAFGYTFLVLGVAMTLFVYAAGDLEVRTGDNCVAGASTTECGSYVITGMGGLWYIPGVVLLIAALPLILFGHSAARRDREEAAEAPAVRDQAVTVNETVRVEGEERRAEEHPTLYPEGERGERERRVHG